MSDKKSKKKQNKIVYNGILNKCKRLIGKNKLYFNTVEYAMSFGSFFFPGGTTNYDTIVEGLNSLTNMVGFLNVYTSQRDHETLNKCSTVLHFSMLLITHVEVLLEKLADNYGGVVDTSFRDITIFYVETIKAIYRLYLLYIVESHSAMLIQWGRGSGDDLKFTYCLQDYRNHLDPTINVFSPSSDSRLIEPDQPFSMDNWEVDVNAIHSSNRPFRPYHREGMGANVTSKSADAMASFSYKTSNNNLLNERNDEKVKYSLNYSPPKTDSISSGRKFGQFSEPSSVTFNPSFADSPVPDTSTISAFSSPSVAEAHSGRQYLRSRTHSGGTIDPRGLPHEPKPASYIDPRFRSWHWYHHLSINEKIPGGTKLLRRCQKVIDVGFNAEQFLLLGETLYVIRPVVYSLFLYQCNKKAAERSAKLGFDRHRQHSQRKGNVLLALAVSMVLEVLSILCTAKALEMTENDCRGIGSPVSQGPTTQTKQATPPRAAEPTAGTHHPMIEELGRRKAAFFLNLLRSPIMDRATLPMLKKVVNMLKYLPLVGSLPPRLLDILDYFSSTYFYTSNSS